FSLLILLPNTMDLKALKFSKYQSEVIELSDTDDELIAVAATESFVSEITSDKSKLDRISISSNDESVQRQLGVLSYESDDISESGSVFDLSSISKLPS
ncbi:3109_t:CDS:2, partial [Dentiscutata erythropus]